MPNVANTAYLAKIESTDVEEVKLFKASYFSTSYIHFVWYASIPFINNSLTNKNLLFMKE